MIGNASFHCWRDAERLVDASCNTCNAAQAWFTTFFEPNLPNATAAGVAQFEI
jgi:hypothetical protein